MLEGSQEPAQANLPGPVNAGLNALMLQLGSRFEQSEGLSHPLLANDAELNNIFGLAGLLPQRYGASDNPTNFMVSRLSLTVTY